MERMLGRSRPFYKAGPVMRLQKIPADRFADFIEARFRATRLRPAPGLGAAIVELAGNLPYDVQRLAHEVWDDAQGGKTVGLDDLHETLKRLLGEHDAHLRGDVAAPDARAARGPPRRGARGRARAAGGRRSHAISAGWCVNRAGVAQRSRARGHPRARGRALRCGRFAVARVGRSAYTLNRSSLNRSSLITHRESLIVESSNPRITESSNREEAKSQRPEARQEPAAGSQQPNTSRHSVTVCLDAGFPDHPLPGAGRVSRVLSR